MNKKAIDFVNDICKNAPTCSKEAVIDYVAEQYSLERDRKVFFCGDFAVRFSYSKNGIFSNTVLSLSALQRYDKIPFFVVLVRGNGSNLIYLANSTFISKISHSSGRLTMFNIRGSFNGSDIIKSYAGIDNAPQHFNELFAIHEGLEWEDNLERLVEASSAIRPVAKKFIPDESQRKNIFASIQRASTFVSSEDFSDLFKDLNERCSKCADAIKIASHIENVNVRGRTIEFLITADDPMRERLKELLYDKSQFLPEFQTKDELGDYVRVFDKSRIYTDIKTKIVYRKSAPKAYNVDKFLQKMAEDDSVFLLFLIGIEENGEFRTALCSVYHNELIDASVVQPHWAGRSTRGVVQFRGEVINKILGNSEFKNQIDQEKAEGYLQQLIDE